MINILRGAKDSNSNYDTCLDRNNYNRANKKRREPVKLREDCDNSLHTEAITISPPIALQFSNLGSTLTIVLTWDSHVNRIQFLKFRLKQNLEFDLQRE